MCMMLVKPSIMLGIGTGIILGIAHMLKASVLPGFVLFVIIYIINEVLWFSLQKSREIKLSTSLSSIILSILFFFVIIFPYINQSREIYGTYFYNVNSTFYIWYDSWEQAKQGEQQYKYTKGWPDLPEDQLPGPTKYIRDHSTIQITNRVVSGLEKQITHITNQYNKFNYLILYSVFAVILCFLRG